MTREGGYSSSNQLSDHHQPVACSCTLATQSSACLLLRFSGRPERAVLSPILIVTVLLLEHLSGEIYLAARLSMTMAVEGIIGVTWRHCKSFHLCHGLCSLRSGDPSRPKSSRSIESPEPSSADYLKRAATASLFSSGSVDAKRCSCGGEQSPRDNTCLRDERAGDKSMICKTLAE